MRRIPALALAILLVGCVGGAPAPASPGRASVSPSGLPGPTVTADPAPTTVPARLSPADDGRVYTMPMGGTTGLVVGDPNAPDPVVDGDSVEVAAIVNIAASGQREWELRAVDLGRTVLTAGGSQPYTITIDVIAP